MEAGREIFSPHDSIICVPVHIWLLPCRCIFPFLHLNAHKLMNNKYIADENKIPLQFQQPILSSVVIYGREDQFD